MNTRFFLSLIVAAGLPLAPALHGQVSVLNYHNDAASTGQNLQEQKLTPASVASTKFGKIFSATLDGQVYAQPLYVPALPITAGTFAGTRHDAVFVGTQHDSVYALDAASGATIWQASLVDGAGGETTVPGADTGSTDITPEIGITSTPVIDPVANGAGLRSIYFVAKSRRVVSGVPHYFFRLHALDIASGAERAGSPLLIAETTHNADNSYTYLSGPTVAGTGGGGNGAVVPFNALREHQRPGLTLSQGKLYIAFASHGDNGPYHGWVLGYDAATLAMTACFNPTPNGNDGGIWQAGGSLSVDAAGALFLATGNGTFANTDGNIPPVPADFDAAGFPRNHNYGDCVLRLVTDSSTAAQPNPNGWGLKVADYFCPFNQHILNNGDTDLGSGGVLLLPDAAGSAAHPHLLVNAGKEGRLYLLDRDKLGKYDGGITGTGSAAAFVSTGDAVVQETAANAISGCLSSAAYFNGTFYYAGAYNNDHAKAFRLANGTFDATPSSVSPDTYGYLGATPSVSASSATTNGIVWMVDRAANQLRAYLAGSLASEIYNSGTAANNRDLLGTAVKFGVPTVADGRVFIGTSGTAPALVCYGLLSDNNTPPAQPLNLFAQTISGGEIALYWDASAVNETGYQIFVSLDPDTFPGTPLTTTGANATSYVVAGLQVNRTYYFKVRAVNAVGVSAFSNTSATTSGDAPPVDFTSGFGAASASAFTFNGFGATPPINGTVLRLTDGGGSQARSAWLNTAQRTGTFLVEFIFRETDASADGFLFVMQRAGLTALGPEGGDMGYTGITPSVAVKFDLYPNGSTTGLYLNGAAPDDGTVATANSSGSIDVGATGIDFHGGNPIRVALAYNGTTLTETITDTVTRRTFARAYTVNLVSVLGNTAYIGFTAGTGGVSATQDILSWSFTGTLPTVPGAPTGLTATAASATEVDLRWTDHASNETGFQIERSVGGLDFTPVGSVGANVTVYADTSLLSNTTYSYRVVATNSDLGSAPSNVVTITTPVAPTRPSDAAPTRVTANEIDFRWSDNSNNETGFRILRENDGGDYKIIATLPANTTTYQDTTVLPDTVYDYHIQAFNAAGYNDFTGFTATTLSAVSIVTTGATAQEGTTTAASFTVRRTNAREAGLTVNYTIAAGGGQAAYGTRYTLDPAPTNATTGAVTIPAGATGVTVRLTPANDPAVLGPQTVTLALAPGAGYDVVGFSTASATVLDTPFNTYRIQQFGSLAAAQSPQAADGADFDRDGVPNLDEYALGNNAAKPGDANLPRYAVDSIGGSRYLTLIFKRPRPAPADITYIVEYSPSLLAPNWQPATPTAAYPVDNGDGTETVKYHAPTPVSGSRQGFMRLRVTRP